MERCTWCLQNEAMTRYHDEEWGTPAATDNAHFECLMLEVLQCGLNWNIIIQKRAIFRACFAGFDVARVAAFDETDIERILNYPGMIRSRRKIEAIIQNAQHFLAVCAAFGSFGAYLASFAGPKMIRYTRKTDVLPVSNSLSERMAKDLKKRGFRFLGPVTVYSYLEACGVINDHSETCFRCAELTKTCPTVFLPPDGDVLP